MSKRSKSLPPSVMSVEVVEEIFEQLKGLSPREQAIIRPVLERDLEFQRREKARVRQLKSMVDMHLIDQNSGPPAMSARRKSAYGLMNSMSSDSCMSVCSLRSNKPALPKPMPEPPSGRACFHCHCRLGLIFNAGTRCAKCGRLLCNECRRGTPRSKWLCQICHAQRELKAASGEWVDAGDPAEISEVLLTQMRRAAMEKEKQEEQKGTVESPRTPMISKRNLTLPTIATPSLLAVPSESELTANNSQASSQKFWGGSPSPRSPHTAIIGSPNYVTVSGPTPPPDRLHPETYQREVIGSPAPRSTTTFVMPSSPVRGECMLPITEIAPPTPTTPSQMKSPLTETRRMAFANSKRGNELTPCFYSSSSRTSTTLSKTSTTISSDKLLQPVDNRPPMRRQLTNSSEDPDQWSRSSRTDAHPLPHSHRAQSTGHVQVQQLRNDRSASLCSAAATSNPDMTQHAPSTIADANAFQRPCKVASLVNKFDAQAAAAAADWEPSRPSDEYTIRRQRPHSQGPVTVRKMKAQAHDRLDVSAADSRRSSGISLPSRSVSQETRLHKGGRVTPASSRDSLSVTSLATEVSADGCTKSSVASQASCHKTTFLGEVQLILSYDIRSACFCVHVIQCRSLPHFGNHKPNPYVKVLLVARDSSVAVLKNKTTPRKAEVNPVFDQVLKS
ncbi:hypothetical protein Y032_0004g1794 [Ancylostoma ceylanicum]|uniref:Uncharacterized protein n=1 Tax=Ancylostoma ceylanicum TaxID=53326 RepID=A0A016VTT5_9BILA|nr:hypothetical protein Y032_0004g1794 [Ancylostoma ceylanicum]